MTRIAFIELGSRLVNFFSAVSNSLGPDIQVFFFCTKPKTRSIASRFGNVVYPKQGESSEPPPDLDDATINKILNQKILTENPNRKKLSRELNRIFASLKAFIETEKIDAMLLWNGSGLVASCAAHLARTKGVRTIYGENGYFYNTMQLDPAGVNQAASISLHIADDYLNIEIDAARQKELEAVIDSYRNDTPVQYTHNPRPAKASLLSRIRDEASNLREREFKWPGCLNRDIPSTPGELPDKYVFIPFQVAKDSQLLLYSPLVGNDMGLFLQHCRTALQAVAANYRIVVKLHPADVGDIDYSGLMKRYPDVIFLKDYPSNELIKSASLVITINSTVGVEALIFGKPVVTLGNNFYNVPEVVHHVHALSELPQAIHTALSAAPDRDKTQRLLYYLYHCYFTHGSWKNYSQQSIEAVAAKLAALAAAPDAEHRQAAAS
jgi:capsular polysaccharide export protein